MKIKFLQAMLLLGATLTGQAQAKNIEFWYGNTGSIEQAILVACSQFNQSQQNDKVTCVGMGSNEAGMQKAIAAYRAKKHPALVQFFDAGTLDLMLSGAIVPLQAMTPQQDWQNILPGIRSYYETVKGELLSQPYNSSTLVLYVNQTQLAQAGITQPPQTWEALVDAARALRAKGHQCPFVTDAHPWRVLEEFAARHGVPIASGHNGYDGLDVEYMFNQGLIAQHLKNLMTWRNAGLVRLESDTRAGKMVQAFNGGECAMMEGSTASYADTLQAFGDRYRVEVALAPIYQQYQRHNTLVGGASIWLMKGHDADSVAAATAFLTFLRQPEQQLKFTEATGYLPVTQSATTRLDQAPFKTDPRYTAARVGVSSLQQPTNADSRGIRLGFYVQFRDVFKEELQKVFSGKQDMQQALDRAKQRGDELLHRFAATYGKS
ncbi:glycerol-3-phosphate transporter periplasmic binding protein [Serratia fonticola]|uniref:extracellular solute-binding protein n=1 Tax=Serratia fonticola TaxID=47917 RepID=UPI0021830C2D|nr:extracellular solute-binding protein [Serratia fonticola]CAI2017104.1 glycerol-3-phosphate transporter periplasmic binding protein [Serratia fonticola]